MDADRRLWEMSGTEFGAWGADNGGLEAGPAGHPRVWSTFAHRIRWRGDRVRVLAAFRSAAAVGQLA